MAENGSILPHLSHTSIQQMIGDLFIQRNEVLFLWLLLDKEMAHDLSSDLYNFD